MAFTFARYLDPLIQGGMVQQKIVAALFTLPFVDPKRDESGGEVWRVMRNWGWITWKHQARDLIFVRRFKLKTDGANPFNKMWIGIQLNGQDYRITCQGLDAAETARMRRQLAFVGADLPDQMQLIGEYGFRARSIVKSQWAARPPKQPRPDDDVAPARPMGGSFYMGGGADALQTTAESPEERAEEQAESLYFA